MSNPSETNPEPSSSSLKLNITWNKNRNTVRTIRPNITKDALVKNPSQESEELSPSPAKKPKRIEKSCPTAQLPTVPNSVEPAEIQNTTLENFPNFLQNVDSSINDLLRSDDILHDLADQGHNGESCATILAFESGQGVRINLKREDGSVLPILIKKSETVSGLKKRIQSETEREIKIISGSRSKQRKVNWRHVWRQNLLVKTEDKLKLVDGSAKLKDVGLVNNTEIRFLKKFRDKKKGRKVANKKKKRMSN